jgi:hypothetical protein
VAAEGHGVRIVDLLVGDRLILQADGGTHTGDGRHRNLVRDGVAVSGRPSHGPRRRGSRAGDSLEQ